MVSVSPQGHHDRPARDLRALASGRLPSVLALEIPLPRRRDRRQQVQGGRLDVVADRGYFNSEEILACEDAGIKVTLPKPMTSSSKAEGRFGKQDFRYVANRTFTFVLRMRSSHFSVAGAAGEVGS